VLPTVLIEPAITEIASVLSVELVAIVLEVHAVMVMTTPGGIIIVIITRVVPLREAIAVAALSIATFATNLRIGRAGY
jgi:hypothetical protein